VNQAPPQPLEPAATLFEAVELSHADVDIGIAIFDIEHHDLLSKLQDLYAAIAAGEPQDRVLPLLARLANVTRQHFAHEEQYMRDFRYPDATRHIDDHNTLATNLGDFVAKYFSGGTSTDQNLASVRAYFKQWLLGHILEYDLALANFLTQKHIR
jgi:hemerythrin